jgi:transcriptional regulator with XRE-family HTH domain
MRTVAPPLNPWQNQTRNAKGNYPVLPHGVKAPGWEDTNITRLAEDLGISFRYLLAVLKGQKNCSLSLLQSVANALGVELETLITRIRRAYQVSTARIPVDERIQGRRRRSSEKAALTP